MRRALAVASAGALALVLTPQASAHGLAVGAKDLPVPRWLFYYGAGLVLVLSFVALGVLWSKPILERAARGSPAPEPLGRITASRALGIAVRAVSVALFLLVWAASAFGTDLPGANLAPTFVYIVFWLGMPVIVVLFGNVWRALNPWRTLADVVASAWDAAGQPWETRRYPARLGYWPAAILLFSFAALELAYTDPSSPRVLAGAIAIYSWATWLGAAAFGREAWFDNGDGFSVYFRLLSRISIFGWRADAPPRQRLLVRPPISALATEQGRAGALAVISVMLGSVAFDGFSRTTFWADRIYSVRAPLLESRPGLGDLLVALMNLGAMVLFCLAVAATFTAAIAGARAIAHVGPRFTESVLWSLVPVAFGYVVAHYFSFFLIAGQLAIPLASDPFGKGWDLLGTSDFRPNLTFLRPSVVWYVQVGALVVGHVLGLTVAHDRALATAPSPRDALRSQYPMLALMVFYTVGGLWILSQG